MGGDWWLGRGKLERGKLESWIVGKGKDHLSMETNNPFSNLPTSLLSSILFQYVSSSIYFKSFAKSSWYFTSSKDALLISKNLLYSLLLPRALPSTMLEGTETAALLI